MFLRNLILLLGFLILPKLSSCNPESRAEVVSSNKLGSESKIDLQNRCPPLLESWIEDDYKDKPNILWMEFNSEAKTCQSWVQNYRNLLLNRNQESSFADQKALGKFYSNQFSRQINSDYKFVLDQCKNLAPEKASAIQTRFYAAGTKYEGVNSKIVEEVAYIDSVVPSPSKLRTVECPPIWPDINEKCESFKLAAQACSSSEEKAKRLNELVGKTQKNIPIIENLILANQKCIAQFSKGPGATAGGKLSKSATEKIQKNCFPIAAAIELKKNEIPWIRGEVFTKIAVTHYPAPRSGLFSTDYDLSSEKISEAIHMQLEINRDAMLTTYQSNLTDFRCLTSKNSPNQNCDFEKIRTRLHAIPEVRQSVFDEKSPEGREAHTYFEAEACLIDRHEDRARTRSAIESAWSSSKLVALTSGIGLIAGGIRGVGVASTLARLGLQGSLLGYNLSEVSQSLNGAYRECTEERKKVITLTQKANLIYESVCSKPNSDLAQAKEAEKNCILNALLTTTSVLPFIAVVPTLKNIFKASKTSVSTKASAASTGEEVAATKVKGGSTTPSPEINPQTHFGSADLVVDNYTLHLTGTGAKTVRLPERYGGNIKPLREGKISDIPAKDRQAELDKLFPGGRERLSAIEEGGKPQALFFRKVSEEQMNEFLHTGQLMPISATGKVKNVEETLSILKNALVNSNFKVGFSEQQADKVIAQLRKEKILELPPSPERDRKFLEIVGHKNWASIHGQGFDAFSPLSIINPAQSFSLGPHYGPTADKYVVVVDDKRMRGMLTNNVFEGEWIFWGGVERQDIVRVMTAKEFERMYGNTARFIDARTP